MTARLETVDDRQALRFERRYDHSVERIWRALTEPDEAPHTFADRAKAARDAAGWDRCFARFDALLRGAPMSEEVSLERRPEVHERHAAEFEVDPELGRKAIAEYKD